MGNYIPQREWDRINRMEFTPSELRVGELYRKYLFMAAWMSEVEDAFTGAGDAECAAIARRWFEEFVARRHIARRLQKRLEDRKRAAKSARMHGRSL